MEQMALEQGVEKKTPHSVEWELEKGVKCTRARENIHKSTEVKDSEMYW